MSGEGLVLLAHELRSPVAALTALAEEAGSLPTPLLRRALALALVAGRDIERLVTDLELLSLHPEEIELRDVLAGLAGPRVSVRGENGRVRGDPTRLRQAVANVVANGLRHGSAVSVAVRREGDRMVVTIADDGPGVPAGLDPFERGASGAGSTGLGLWLAREIARAHDGELSLEPGAGGATFRLALPASSGAPA